MVSSIPSNVEPIHEKDYPRVVEVWEASVRATHHFITEADIDFFRPLVRNEALPSVTLVGTRDADGQVIGFAGVAHGKLEMLFVDPAWRGKGVGGRLLTHAIESLGVTTLDVNEQNEQATGFYQKAGFTVVGRSEVDGTGKPFPILHMQLRR